MFGSGSANLGAASLLHTVGGMPKSKIIMTGSRGVIWKSADGTQGNFKNNEQKEFAVEGEPSYPHRDLVDIITNTRPSCLIGASGMAPGAFSKAVIEKMVEVNAEGDDHDDPSHRPVIFALSNPTSQAECTSAEAFGHSKGVAIYGAGTAMPPVSVNGHDHFPGQVNNVYIFPGMSMAAIFCQAKTITDRLFLVAAQAVANSLSANDLAEDRVIPPVSRVRDVAHNVATAVVMACQEDGLAQKITAGTYDEVHAAVGAAMYKPP